MADLTPEQAEYFATPRYAVRRFIERVEMPFDGRWLEPCVGEGAILEALPEVTNWYTCDIRPTGAAQLVGDYTRHPPSHRLFEVGITNPPFSKALQVVAHMLEQCDHVAIYQRLNWMESDDRCAWLQAHPFGLYVLPQRPSHTGNGKTDGCAYGWYLWPAQHDTVQILDPTPLIERRRDEAESFAASYRGPEQLALGVS